jgi:hypothetical protein
MIQSWVEPKNVDQTEMESRVIVTRGWGVQSGSTMERGWLVGTKLHLDENKKFWGAIAQ